MTRTELQALNNMALKDIIKFEVYQDGTKSLDIKVDENTTLCLDFDGNDNFVKAWTWED